MSTSINYRALWLIMVIELSGVPFDLKSYAWFQIKQACSTSLTLKSKVWFQTKIAKPKVQLPLYYIHFEIAQLQTTRFWSVPLYIEPVAGLSKSKTRNAFTSHFENTSASCQRDVMASRGWLFCFTILFSLAEKKMRFRAKNSVICE